MEADGGGGSLPGKKPHVAIDTVSLPSSSQIPATTSNGRCYAGVGSSTTTGSRLTASSHSQPRTRGSMAPPGHEGGKDLEQAGLIRMSEMTEDGSVRGGRLGGGGGGATAAAAAAAAAAAEAPGNAAAAGVAVPAALWHSSSGKPDPSTSSQAHEQRRRGCAGWLRGAAKDYWLNVRRHPAAMLLPPLLTFAVLCAASVAGVVLGADKYEQEERGRASSAALDWAASFRLSVENSLFTPLVTLGILIAQNPQLPSLLKSFPSASSQLMERINANGTVVQELQLSPMGVIEAIYPKNADTDTRLGINIFKQPALRGGALATIEQRRLVVNGPLKLVQGNFGTIARIPIFIEDSTLNETFGTNRSLPDDCGPLCFNETTGEKFWGFATAIGPLDDMRAGNDSRLDMLHKKPYRYRMTRPYTATEKGNATLARPELTDSRGDFVFANSSTWPSDDAVVSNITVGNSVWKVFLEPEGGWRPPWEHGLVAAVVLGSLLVAALVGVIAASWVRQKQLLGDVMESNVLLADTTSKLQDEKVRLDNLLVRQYNLLTVLGSQRGGGGVVGGPRGDGSQHSSSSKEGLTLERIESMRRQLAVNSNTSTQDLESIQTIELLGEGTFGKVYKGLWRGTVVAVKTMVLPANMSGAEKREKMAVMEAAISSSLSHPNIVQTFTYCIRPIREVSEALPEHMGGSVTSEPGDTVTTMPSRLSMQRPLARTDSDVAGNVHSYEVRLVIEYCDKGCLRDALDAGSFSPGGELNYLAVLDTAADVAKAMLHLHSLNVLHSDLKARNVMLSTAGDGRGVVAKVADFGLSVKMDHQETHISSVFQGTITHMAPEILLEGRVSKAADVYAFGITLWELYTAQSAFKGMPRALLGHQVTREELRPKFPEGCPLPYRNLAERCWHPRWEQRPSFGEILDDLVAMRAMDPAPTPQLSVQPQPPARRGAYRQPPGASTARSAGGSSGGGGGGSSLVSSGALASTASHGEPRSVYLDHSYEDSLEEAEVDWSHGASGSSASVPLVQRVRARALPKISEGENEADRDTQSAGGSAGGSGRHSAGAATGADGGRPPPRPH